MLSKSTPWLFVDVVANAESCVVAIRRIVTASHADPDQRRSIIVSTKLQAGSESAATAAPGTVLHSLLFQQSPLSTSRASRLSFYYYSIDKLLLEVEEELHQVSFAVLREMKQSI